MTIERDYAKLETPASISNHVKHTADGLRDFGPKTFDAAQMREALEDVVLIMTKSYRPG